MEENIEIKRALDWQSAGEFSDILYEKAEGIAKLTINRPRVRNAFRPETVLQLCQAFADAREDPAIGVIILTGAAPWLSARAVTKKFAAMAAMSAATACLASMFWTSNA